MTFAIYPSDRAQVSRQSVTIFFSFLFFFFFFFFFFFERLIGLLFRGLDLLKVVKGTRPEFGMVYEAKHSFNLSLKPNVQSVWLVQSGRKRLNTIRISIGYQLN